MRILIFSAHPDDAEYGMGGTLVQLGKHHALTLYVVTDGGSGSFGSGEIRRAEQQEAAKLVGAELVWGGLQDCHVEYTRAQALALAQVIRDRKPDLVFVPHWDQRGGVHDGLAHPDHRALGLLVRDAARFARFRIADLRGEKHDARLLYYMVPAHRTGKLAVPLTDIEGFRRLLRAHNSQLQIKGGALEEYLFATRRMAAQHYPGAEYAEVFDADEPLLLRADLL